jgi:hypothetical protein
MNPALWETPKHSAAQAAAQCCRGGEAGETIFHLFITKLKGYNEPSAYSPYQSR